MDQYIGKLLDNRYEILERIGTGGMAVVYKGRDQRLNRLVAIKILKEELAQDAEFRRRFHDESQAVAMLSHPNIMAVYDVSRSEQVEYIVMELIDGITLKQYMQRKGGPLSWKESLHFITQIMKALSHAHSRGIIHRDIKPHNIMVLRDGSVKVADFGIARLVSAAQNTLTQEALGSVHYISPEQARGSHIDCRSDIYSAGVVLYEMLTGRLPYEGDSPVSVAIQHINSIPLSPREINPDIPEALEAITMKAMASDVEKRYASADAMLADLEEFRKNPNISFDYTQEDLLPGSDEPTQVMTAGTAQALRGAAQGERRSGEGSSSARRRRYEDDFPEEEEERMSRRRKSRNSDRGSPLPAIFAVGAILIFLVGIAYFLWSIIVPMLTPTEEYTVPTLVGKQLEEVQADLESLAPFTISDDITVDYNSDAPAGEIIDQDPAAGSQVKSGSLEITLTVSGGADTFLLENYVNRRFRDVELLLTSRGILVEREDVYDDAVTEGFIVSQDVDAGTALQAGDTVTFQVSRGPEPIPVTVPSLTGQTLEDASRIITQDLKLVLGETEQVFDPEAPVGTVVGQSLGPNDEVYEGDTIDLQVSKGPDPAVTEEPSPTPEQPSPSPEEPSPTPEQPATVVKSIRVDLPEGRTEPIQVTITVGGVVKYDRTIDATVPSPIYPPLESSGVQEVLVYFDNVLVDSATIDFSNG